MLCVEDIFGLLKIYFASHMPQQDNNNFFSRLKNWMSLCGYMDLYVKK